MCELEAMSMKSQSETPVQNRLGRRWLASDYVQCLSCSAVSELGSVGADCFRGLCVMIP